jgi:hypothetical protein
MSLVIIIGAGLLVWFVVAVIKELDAEAKCRWEDQVMADYVQAEDARFHYQDLTAIDATVRTTIEELDRIAAEANGEIIEGTVIEERSS